MHLDFANLLNLVSTITLIGALIFTGLQVRAANRARREQAAVTMIQTAALSENSARFLELLSEIPEGASVAIIENLAAETRNQIWTVTHFLDHLHSLHSRGVLDRRLASALFKDNVSLWVEMLGSEKVVWGRSQGFFDKKHSAS